MRISARAPGKLVVLGEYAVLDGAPALVMAVDRYCRATLGPSEDGLCHLATRAGERRAVAFEPGAAAGIALVDAVTRPAGRRAPAWRAELDSSELFAGGAKLGLGSSAAAICAWAGAWGAYLERHGLSAPETGLERLVALHREVQGGAGSGLDVAAALQGGLVVFRLEGRSEYRVGSVKLPNGVAFAGIFAGRSASTPGFVARYRAWQSESAGAAARLRHRLERIAADGCAAAADGDADAFVRAVTEYGHGLDELGRAMRTEIVTSEHRRLAEAARRFGVAYKVSGAGGGDMGVAVAADAEDLAAFRRAIGAEFDVVDLRLDRHGLAVAEDDA